VHGKKNISIKEDTMKTKRLLTMVVATMVLALVFTGCGSASKAPEDTAASTADQTAAPSEQKGTVSSAEEKFIGVAFPSTLVDRWTSESNYLKEGLEKLGYKAEIQYANEDANLQIKQCENFLAQGVDMLVVCAADTTAAATIVEKAHQEGVPVVAYCRMIQNCDVDAFVAEDNDMVGTMQGQFIVDNVEEGNIIVLGGSPNDNNAILYHDKGLEALKPKIDSGAYKIIADQFCDSWQPSKAMSNVENALTQAGNDVAAILCPNDGLAGGAIEALAAQKLDGKVVVTGGDGELAAAKRIAEGTQTMTIFKNPVKISGAAVKAIDAILKGEKPEYNAKLDNGQKDVDAVLVEMTVITKDNIQDEFIDAGFFTEEQLKN
jgi:D-xylose transport system substrate-binding protein